MVEKSLSKTLVLVIDGERDVRFLIKKSLERALAVEVEEAESIRDAVAQGIHKFRFIVCGPSMNITKTCQALTGNPGTKTNLILITHGEGSLTDLPPGVVTIPKFDIAKLIETLRNSLSDHQC